MSLPSNTVTSLSPTSMLPYKEDATYSPAQSQDFKKAQDRTASMVLGNFEQWLKLMVASIQNQDPLNPMDSTQMAAQFAQFGQTIGMMEIKKQLEEITKSQSLTQLFDAASQLDRYAEVQGNRFVVEKGQAPEMTYTTPVGADKVVLTLTNQNNKIVKLMEGDAAAGSHSFRWDGKSFDGQSVENGEYKLFVAVLDKSGRSLIDPNTKKALDIKTTVKGVISGGEYRDGKPLVKVNGVSLPMTSLISIQSMQNKGLLANENTEGVIALDEVKAPEKLNVEQEKTIEAHQAPSEHGITVQPNNQNT